MLEAFVSIQAQDFSVEAENAALAAAGEVGALVNFIGVVRQQEGGQGLLSMTLEHYPGMTERTIHDVIARAEQRWQLHNIRVIHRIGTLALGEQIVYVGVAAKHRQQAFDACSFVMDFLKMEAPFWKKEALQSGDEQWVDARDSDAAALLKWNNK